MISDEEMQEFLTGTKGVPGLDLAREVVALRERCASLETQCQAALEACARHQDLAECKMQEHAEAKDRLSSICESLATMCGGLREFLGNAEQKH